MGSLLPQSPHAASLLALAARRATGRIALGGRTLVLASGDVVDIAPAADDESIEQVLIKSGRVTPDVLAHYEHLARNERTGIAELLVKHGALSDLELRHVRRAALVDRLTRALRSIDERDTADTVFDAAQPSLLRAPGLPLPALLLDALTRTATTNDASVVGANLNHRVDWIDGPHENAAREWADLGEGPQRPAVSTVLAKRPAAAPRIAALLRAGLARLLPPGRTASTSSPPAPGNVPAPAPRPPAPPDARPVDRKPRDPLALVDHTRAPRLRLDPGQVQENADPLEPTPLPRLPEPSIELADPLLALERRVAELEAASAPGPERARAFTALAEVWRDRFGSLERASRAFREAAAADPSDTRVLQQAAVHCHVLGQSELAARYAAAAVAAASLPNERAEAQRLRARIARSAGDIETCLEALCEAAADDPACADPHEQIAALLLERGNVEGANAHARLAGTAIQDDEPERALALLAWAFGLMPGDLPTAYEYASLLDASGHKLGTIAVLAETAWRSANADQRRKLRLSAAERAEAAGRADVAAELMVDAFDSEPHFDLVYGPMDEDLGAVGSAEYRAVTLEDVATVCPDEQRAYWLRRAGQAMLLAQDQPEAALWLLFEALLTDGSERAALDALREHAEECGNRGLTLLAHGLRAAIVAHLERDAGHAERLLHELAELSERRLDNAHMAFAAYQQLALMQNGPELRAANERCAQRVEQRNADLAAAEQALASAEGTARLALCEKLATIIPDLPERWPREIQLLREIMARGGGDGATRERLETLIALSRDAIALATFLEDHAEQSTQRQDRMRLLSRLAAVHTVREDTPAVAAVCEGLLAIDSSCRIAIARLERAARRLSDQRRIARALTLRAAVTREPRARGRVLAQLARAEEAAGLHNEATRHAVEALREDPGAVDSGLILLRNVHRIDPRLALSGLGALRDACGASRALLSTQTQVAHASGQREAQRSAVEAWTALLPNDAAAHRTRLLLYADESDAAALLAAAHAALTAVPSTEVIDAAHTALERLEALGAFEAAAELGLRLAEEQGKSDAALARRVVVLGRRGRAPETLTRALELVVAVGGESERVRALFDLSAHHRARRDFTAEVRALHRVLEIEPRNGDALDRLHELLLQAGDTARLLAVDGWILESESDRDRRKPLLLLMCAVAAQRARDLDRAEHYVRELLSERREDPRHVRQALGVLLSIGEPRWALERCCAVADRCPPALGSTVYLWCALTAELRVRDAALALQIARDGALRFPSYAESLLVVERLTLAADDADTAIATYDALIAAASGPHGRRALLYRAGRWLERAGQLSRALERYLAAFEASPTTGAAFKALERVARETDSLALVVPCYERLAEHLAEPRARLLMLVKASELCRGALRDQRRAFDLLLRANTISERAELDERLFGCARDLAARNDAAAPHAIARFSEQLRERAEQAWSAEDKGRCLLRLARLSQLAREEPGRALAYAQEALDLAQREELSALASEAEALRGEIEQPATNPEPAVLATPPQVAAAPRSPPPPPSPAPSHRAPPARALAQPAPAVVLESSPAQELPPALPTPPPAHEPPPAPPATPPAPRVSDAQRRRELREVIAAEPFRTDALRELHALCERDAGDPEAHVLAQLLAAIDGARMPSDRELHAGVWRGGALRAAIGASLDPDLALGLTTLWESTRGMPRFRSSLGAHGVSERDRITRISFGPIADAYARALRLLELPEISVYVTLASGAGPRVVPTHPPVVVAARGLAQSQQAMLYGMAHALWLARPEHVIGGVLAPRDAGDLLEGARLAFSTVANARSGSASAGAKELAAALWQNVSARSQAPLAQLLRVRADALRPETLRAQIRASAARAALLVSGSLASALRTLPLTEPELEGVALGGEQVFVSACQRSPALAETVRCALSDAFLDALRRAS